MSLGARFGLMVGRQRTDGVHLSVAFPGESGEYRAARLRLLEQGIELRGAMEQGGSLQASAPAARRRLT